VNTTPTTHKDLIRTHFDSYAPTWHDRLANHVYAMRYRAVERMVAKLSPASVLDVGCGTGDFVQLFDPSRTRYLGIDISPNMIAECRRLFPSHAFKVADGDSIDAPDASVDLVLSIGVLEYLQDPVSHLKELVRVTRPGGHIIVTVPNGSNRSRQLDRPIRAMLDSAPGKWVRRTLGRPSQIRPAERTVVKDSRIKHRQMTVDELREIGARHGLALVDHSHVSLYFASELVPGAAALNDVLSRALSDRPVVKWLQRLTSLVLVVKFEKRAS
jgi:ubiquinone/menaquinone biosynthesis C-methylase UbiE